MSSPDLPVSPPDPPGLPLAQLRGARCPAPAVACRLLALDCARDDPRAQRLRMLGLRAGVEVRVLHAPGPRGAVLGLGSARIALGPELLPLLRVRVP